MAVTVLSAGGTGKRISATRGVLALDAGGALPGGVLDAAGGVLDATGGVLDATGGVLDATGGVLDAAGALDGAGGVLELAGVALDDDAALDGAGVLDVAGKLITTVTGEAGAVGAGVSGAADPEPEDADATGALDAAGALDGVPLDAAGTLDGAGVPID